MRLLGYALTVALLSLSVGTALAKTPTKAAKPSKALQEKFIQACIHAYEASDSKAPSDVGSKICQCAGPEAKSQGATSAALQSETRKLEKDPKYKFRDKHVLDAIKYCTITTLDVD